MEVIAVANQKGGCGKTTTTVNLAAYLALRGFHVLLIDLDPQGSSTTHLGIDKDNMPKNMNEVMMDRAKLEDIIIPTTVKGLDIAPTNNDLVEADGQPLGVRVTGDPTDPATGGGLDVVGCDAAGLALPAGESILRTALLPGLVAAAHAAPPATGTAVSTWASSSSAIVP